MITFRLNEFQAIAKWLKKHLPGPLFYIAQGWLYGLETRYIDAKTVSAVEQAIAPHRPPEPTLSEPTFTPSPSEVEGLDIIQLTNDAFPKKR